jgi:hypothetical protein
LCASVWNNKKYLDTVDARYKHEDKYNEMLVHSIIVTPVLVVDTFYDPELPADINLFLSANKSSSFPLATGIVEAATPKNAL